METKRKKSVNEQTEDFRPFWEPLFSEMGIANPIFFAKLCYNSNDFPGGGAVVRVYAEQISKGQDMYVEFFNWEDTHYNGVRALYKFKNNPNWREDTDSYVEVTKKGDGTPMPTPSYIFKFSSFELVKSVEITALSPISTGTPVAKPSKKELDVLEEEITSGEKDDNHYAQMTIRDIYAIVQNTPISNKKWLNKIITENRKGQ